MTHPMTFLRRLYNERLVVTSLYIEKGRVNSYSKFTRPVEITMLD